MAYIPVRIGTLRGGHVVNFDVFILIGDRHVHYINKDDPFEEDRLTKLKAKGVRKLFIEENSESAYLEYLDAGLDQMKNTSVAIEKKADIAHDALVTSAENAIKNVDTEVGYQHTEKQVTKVIDFLLSEKGAMHEVLSASGIAVDNFQHAANVATLSVSLADKLGITGEAELLELGVAALLHDIGKEGMNLPNVPRDQFTVQQMALYQTHPRLGAEKLADKPYINANITALILDHEEVGEGLGFPNKKRLKTLPLSQQILNLCNEYDSLCSERKIPPLEATKIFYIEKVGLFELEHIKALTEILQKKS